jgi:uncharacterized membrane protein
MAAVFGLLVVTVGFLAANPALTNPAHTEFYVLNESGNASDYPETLAPGEPAEVTVGIGNHEHEPVEYRVAVTWNGTTTTERSIRIPDETTRELPINITAPNSPGRYRVEFQLYHSGGPEPDLTTWLWIRVQR